MKEEIYTKLDELISTIDNNDKVRRMKNLKEQIYKDKTLKKDLEELRKLEDNSYSSKYVELKSKILNNSLVKEYKLLENELYFTTLEMNKRLNELVSKRKCTK